MHSIFCKRCQDRLVPNTHYEIDAVMFDSCVHIHFIIVITDGIILYFYQYFVLALREIERHYTNVKRSQMVIVSCFCGKKLNKSKKLVDVIHSFCESKSLMNFAEFAWLLKFLGLQQGHISCAHIKV